MIVRTPDNASRQIFGGRCPYTGEMCDDWVCEICPTEKTEMVMMEQLDTEGEDLSKNQLDTVNNALDCIRHFCQTQRSCDDCPIYTRDGYHTCLFRTGIAPAHWGNVEITNRKEGANEDAKIEIN